jgi:hypothetical protein
MLSIYSFAFNQRLLIASPNIFLIELGNQLQLQTLNSAKEVFFQAEHLNFTLY